MAARRCQPDTLLYKIPFGITNEICKFLDTDHGWETLASAIGYTFQEIQEFRLEYQRSNGSPTSKLLWDWGTKNPTAQDLYMKLKVAGRIREMRLLEPIFSNCQENPNEDKRPNAAKGPGSHGTDGATAGARPRTPAAGHQENATASVILQRLSQQNLPRPKPPGMQNNQNSSEKEENKEDVNMNIPKRRQISSKHLDDKVIPGQKGMLAKDLSQSEDPSGKGASSIRTNECAADGLPEPKENAEGASSLVFHQKLMESIGSRANLPIMQNSDCDWEVAVAIMGSVNYTYKEMSQATNGFSENSKLGEGAFGEVYMGELKNTKCAIKRLFQRNESNEKDKSSSAHMASELRALVRYRHENIVTLYGYALDGEEVCLVYQLMANGSLEDRIHCKGGTPPLTWAQRMRIVCGAACGLQYLHTLDTKPLIHGDIKSANVLLDKHFEAKIGDMGLAQHATGGTDGAFTHITKKEVHSKIYECKAYLPPEVLRGNSMSIKGDTFSFGVVLFEVATGEKAFDHRREGEKFLAEYISNQVEKMGDEECMMHLQDKKGGECPKGMWLELFNVACSCTKRIKKDRPDMVQVLKTLQKLEEEYITPVQGNMKATPESPVAGHSVHMEKPLSFSSGDDNHAGRKVDSPVPLPCVKAPEKLGIVGSLESVSTYPNPLHMLSAGQPIPDAIRLQLMYDRQSVGKQEDGHHIKLDCNHGNRNFTSNLPYHLGPRAAETSDEMDKLAESDPKKLEDIQNFDLQNLKISDEIPSADTDNVKFQSDPKKLLEISKFDATLHMPKPLGPKRVQSEHEEADPVERSTDSADPVQILADADYDGETSNVPGNRDQMTSCPVRIVGRSSATESRNDVVPKKLETNESKPLLSIVHPSDPEINEQMKQQRMEVFNFFDMQKAEAGYEDETGSDDDDERFFNVNFNEYDETGQYSEQNAYLSENVFESSVDEHVTMVTKNGDQSSEVLSSITGSPVLEQNVNANDNLLPWLSRKREPRESEESFV